MCTCSPSAERSKPKLSGTLIMNMSLRLAKIKGLYSERHCMLRFLCWPKWKLKATARALCNLLETLGLWHSPFFFFLLARFWGAVFTFVFLLKCCCIFMCIWLLHTLALSCSYVSLPRKIPNLCIFHPLHGRVANRSTSPSPLLHSWMYNCNLASTIPQAGASNLWAI